MTLSKMRRRCLAGLLAGGLAGVVGLVGAGASPAAASGGVSANDRRDLASARAATAAFHNVDKALAAGYLEDVHCVASPAGVMGYHYIKPSLFGSTDPTQPAGLLYVDKPNGGKRLVAVEYLVADADGNLRTDGDRPTLFGDEFDGPMPGHGPNMPVHYDQHVWLWAHNPNGMFAQWNPTLSC